MARLEDESEGEVELRLDRPAPFDFEVVISLKSGNPNLVEGMPEKVEFKEGETKVTVQLRTVDRQGKARFRAALPFDLGGDHDDLEIEVEKD